MKTIRYFEEQVLVKRPYIKREWCHRAIQKPVQKEIQTDGRIRKDVTPESNSGA